MNSFYETELTILAEKMSELTCELSRKCAEKERHFGYLVKLTPAEFKCLRLFMAKDEIPVKKIAENLKITQGRVTHIVTSLEQKNLIKRKLNDDDKRNVIAYLTEKSKPLLKSLNEMYVQLHKELLQQIEPEKRKLVLETMEEIIYTLDSWIQQHPSVEAKTQENAGAELRV